MRFFAGPSKGFVLRYDGEGKHIRSKSYDIDVGEGVKYHVDISALFLPLQLHEEEKKYEEELM